MTDLEKLKSEFSSIMGDPVRADGSRRTVTIMVVNSGNLYYMATSAAARARSESTQFSHYPIFNAKGVMDLLLNFLCSARLARIALEDTLVYVGQVEDVRLVQSMGLKAMFR